MFFQTDKSDRKSKVLNQDYEPELQLAYHECAALFVHVCLCVCACYHHAAVDVKAGRTDRDWQFHSETKSTDRTTVDNILTLTDRQTDRS